MKNVLSSVIILKGLPASGKSTWAEQQVKAQPNKYKRITKDQLRLMLDAGQWSSKNEKFVERARDQLILLALQEGKIPIVDDTNFSPQHEQRIRELVGDRAEVEVKFFDVDVEECIRRDDKRPNKVGEKVIRDMYNKYLRPKPTPPVRDTSLPTAVVCDLDGTLAILNRDAIREQEKCYSDTVNFPVWKILHEMDRMHRIIFVSGRTGSAQIRKETERWLLDKAGFYVDGSEVSLFMRSDSDTRKDSVIKKTLYENYIKGQYNVLMWLDDRNQIVRMVRDELGIPCWQVNDGDF